MKKKIWLINITIYNSHTVQKKKKIVYSLMISSFRFNHQVRVRPGRGSELVNRLVGSKIRYLAAPLDLRGTDSLAVTCWNKLHRIHFVSSSPLAFIIPTFTSESIKSLLIQSHRSRELNVCIHTCKLVERIAVSGARGSNSAIIWLIIQWTVTVAAKRYKM